jgi:hypothetical protein
VRDVRSEPELPRGLRASACSALELGPVHTCTTKRWLEARAPRSCERREIARRRTEEEPSRALSSASDDDGDGFHARLSEQQAQKGGAMREQPSLEKLAWAPPSMSCRGPLGSRS